MDNLLQLAMQMILCLLIAAIIGAIIGYLLGKMSKCDHQEEEQITLSSTQELNDYENKVTKKSRGTDTNLMASATDIASIASDETEEMVSSNMQAIKKNIEGIDGHRPNLISTPQEGQADDLKEISGIGLKIEEALNELGIFHFDQIASWTPENAKWIDNYLVFKGRVTREDWIGQAKLLAAGGSTQFSRKVHKGEKKY